MGSMLVANTTMFESRLNDVFGGALNETLTYLTVEPQSNEVVDLKFKVSDGSGGDGELESGREDSEPDLVELMARVRQLGQRLCGLLASQGV